MAGQAGLGADFASFGHSAAIPVETDARAELTVGDVTTVDWLSVVVKELERRPYATTGFTGDAGQLLAGRAVTRFWPLRPPPPYLGSLLGDRQHGRAGL